MNLKFGICWVEDQPSEAEQGAVEMAVRESGFEPEIKLVKSQPEVHKCAERQERFQEYELILLDLRLGGELEGDTLALEIRQSFRSTPILFYSGETVVALRKRMAEKGVEGVYCAERRDLEGRVRELVSDLSPRLNRLSGMRGLAAQIVAECDHEFRQILQHLAGSSSSEQKLIASLRDRVEKSNLETSKSFERLDSLDELLESSSVSSALLFREVRHQLKSYQSEEILEKRDALKSYETQVLALRNRLAHALEKETAEGWQIAAGLNREAQPLTVGDFGDIRLKLLLHLEEARSLRKLLIGKDAN